MASAAMNMAKNLFNHVMSFSNDSKTVSISSIEMWLRSTETKLAQGLQLKLEQIKSSENRTFKT